MHSHPTAPSTHGSLPTATTLQSAFSRLLGDQSELTQEMASRGVTLVYGLGDEATRKELLQGLVGVLQGQAKPIKVGGGRGRGGGGCLALLALPAAACRCWIPAGPTIGGRGGLPLRPSHHAPQCAERACSCCPPCPCPALPRR